jgi:hypothetical protein
MAGLTLRSGTNSIFPMRTTVRARGQSLVTHDSRGRSGEPAAGFQLAG